MCGRQGRAQLRTESGLVEIEAHEKRDDFTRHANILPNALPNALPLLLTCQFQGIGVT